ncbi:hypothetical protein OPT61_g10129 [Boeremia exigua]|uniref:Uncharacterized protein n=1 Tax=Boeremia exigua TaxID=749465 RepID=A0ACC2HR23_9PLEO|nr:hypothetical protein OPT61_g10129 [Boeremia exigua]
MSRPTVTVQSPKGESSKETIAVPNVFKVSRRQPQPLAHSDTLKSMATILQRRLTASRLPSVPMSSTPPSPA